jgi:hypothetical protein
LLCPEHDASVRRRDLEGIASLGFNTVVFWPPPRAGMPRSPAGWRSTASIMPWPCARSSGARRQRPPQAPHVDVSVLVDVRGRPTLVGICNYRHQPSDVELALPLGAVVHLEADARAVLARGDGHASTRVRVDARQAVALLCEHPAENARVAG